jgi:hypothetical protein
LQQAQYRINAATDVLSALETFGKDEIDLKVMENDTSCVQGELAAVRLKTAASCAHSAAV